MGHFKDIMLILLDKTLEAVHMFFFLNVDMYLHMKGLFLEMKSMISCLPEGNGRNSDLWNVMSIVDQLIFH